MNKLQKVIAIITILSVSSCGEFFYHNEQVNFNKKFILKKPKKYCSTTEEKSSLELAGSNVKAVKIFKKLIQTVPQIQRLSLIELSVMWSLFQLNIRPDLVSPTSRLQMLVKIKKSVKYFQFDEKTSQTPFLNGLNYLLKKYRSKKSINKLASLLYRNLPRTIPIDNDFSVFLKKNESELQKYDQFKTVFFKAAHVIKRGESIPKLNFRKLVSKMHKKTRISPRTHLFTSRHYKRNRVKCNIDLDLYHNNIFLISRRESHEGLPFSISKKNGDHVILVASNYLRKIKPFNNFFSLKGRAIGNPLVFCHVKNKETKNEYTIVSSKGRDPGQFIFHLLNLDVQNSKSLKEAQKYINSPRYLFLKSPDRLVYESSKGSEEQLKNYLNLNFPIYHKTHLGRVWIHAKLNRTQRSGLLLDSRSEGALACIR